MAADATSPPPRRKMVHTEVFSHKRHTILAYYNNKPDYVNLLTDSWGLPDASPYSFWRQSNIANFVLIILCGDCGRFATAFNYAVTITRGVINHRVTASCMSTRYAEINNTSLLSGVHIVHREILVLCIDDQYSLLIGFKRFLIIRSWTLQSSLRLVRIDLKKVQL